MIKFTYIWWLITHANVGIATTFSSQDKYNPNPQLACQNRILDDQVDIIVAHPKLPCRSTVWIYNLRNGKSVKAKVMDRGPRKAALDLSPRTTKAIKSNGYELVIYVPF